MSLEKRLFMVSINYWGICHTFLLHSNISLAINPTLFANSFKFVGAYKHVQMKMNIVVKLSSIYIMLLSILILIRYQL
jgi:hypothetical protein